MPVWQWILIVACAVIVIAAAIVAVLIAPLTRAPVPKDD